jgi:serine/threonine protein kinase
MELDASSASSAGSTHLSRGSLSEAVVKVSLSENDGAALALSKYGDRHAFKIKSQKFIIDKRYSPVRSLGAGAYGVVCSAIDKEAPEKDGEGKKVAIKKVSRAFEDVTDAKRILREIKLLRHFNHDNVVKLGDMVNPFSKKEFEDVYLVMELMDSDLHRIIHSKNKLTEEHFQYFIYQVLCGLKYIHSANVVHRDLKPSNLLLNANCELKICDFGLARGVQDPTSSQDNLTEYVVTRWYRAPEIMVSCQEYDKKIDVWSVGCILAELLGRKPLFPGDNYIHQLDLIFGALGTPSEEDLSWMTNERACEYFRSLPKKEKIPFRKLFPKASEEAVDLLEKMLVFNPIKRISVDEALEHPFFTNVRNPKCETEADSKFDFSYEKVATTKYDLQEMMFDEICHFRPEAAFINPLKKKNMDLISEPSNTEVLNG